MSERKDGELEKETTRIARLHGCDRGTFTVCWGELERGETCRCKEEARALLAERSKP